MDPDIKMYTNEHGNTTDDKIKYLFLPGRQESDIFLDPNPDIAEKKKAYP